MSTTATGNHQVKYSWWEEAKGEYRYHWVRVEAWDVDGMPLVVHTDKGLIRADEYRPRLADIGVDLDRSIFEMPRLIPGQGSVSVKEAGGETHTLEVVAWEEMATRTGRFFFPVVRGATPEAVLSKMELACVVGTDL